MDGFMPCPGRRPLASNGLPNKYHNKQLNNVAGIHNWFIQVVSTTGWARIQRLSMV
jgi:hypothetical protein